MKSVYVPLLLAVLLACAPLTMGDSVTLKNGDRLTGTVTGTDGKQLTMNAADAGVVNVAWSNVQEVATEKPVYVVTAKKQTVSGTISLEGTNLVVHTAAQGAVTVPLGQVTIIRSAEAQDAYEKGLHPSLARDWKGGVNVGYAMARGNSNTTSLNVAVNAGRKTLSDNVTVYESSVYTTNGATVAGGPTGVTADAILGGVRYERNFTKRAFAFAGGDFTHDALQDLVLRSIYTGGAGWHAIVNPKTTLDLLGGVNYTRETYSSTAAAGTPSVSVARNLPGITAGEVLMRKLGANTTLTEDFNFYPDLSDLSEYRFALDARAVTKIKSWLGWQISVSDRYVTNPPIIGTKSNDFILSTGLNFSFAH